MYKKKLTICVLLTLFTSSTFHLINFPFTAKAQAAPTVYADPAFTSTQIGTAFSVNISITEVTDLCSWQVYIYFKNQILEATGYTEGPFIKSHGTTLFAGNYDNNYNETHGELWMYCLRTWNGTGINGSGVLGTSTFKGKNAGTSPLNLANTILGNSTAQRIAHTTTDGTVEVVPTITITNVTPFAPIAGQGILFPINVTTLNEADEPATFDLTLYYDSTPIETKQLTQPKQTSMTTTFMWVTTELTLYQNYAISASTGHDTFMDGTITLVIPGDVDADRDVDLFDAVRLLSCYGAKAGMPDYDPNCDIDCDGGIILYDAVILLIHYGEKET